MPHQEEEQAGSSSHTPSIFEHAQKAAEAIPAEVEVMVEVDEMTQEEFEYFGTTNLTFAQAQMLDAMRANSQAVKAKANQSEYSPWAFKVRNLHPPGDASSSRQEQPIGMDEAEDMRRAIQESLELARQERERAERELHEDLAKVKDAEEAELKELWDKVDEEHEQLRRERNRRHRL